MFFLSENITHMDQTSGSSTYLPLLSRLKLRSSASDMNLRCLRGIDTIIYTMKNRHSAVGSKSNDVLRASIAHCSQTGRLLWLNGRRRRVLNTHTKMHMRGIHRVRRIFFSLRVNCTSSLSRSLFRRRILTPTQIESAHKSRTGKLLFANLMRKFFS